MPELVGIDCYHFQRSSDHPASSITGLAWRVGETYQIGQSFNRYFDFFYRRVQLHRAPRQQAARPVAHAARVLDTVEQDTSGQHRWPGHGDEDVVATLRGTTTALQAQCNLVRELVFEDIRARFYPACPSRHRCVWLAPSVPAMHYWDRRGPRQKTWFRARLLDGQVHLADASLVRAEYQSVAELEALAHRYWAGVTDPRTACSELLFIGKLKVLDLLRGAPVAGAPAERHWHRRDRRAAE